MLTLEKMIKVSEEAFERLYASRCEGESLTDVILREIGPKNNKIMDLFGAWEGDEEEFQRIFGDILKGRRATETRDLEAVEWSA
jgi:predicted CopG family antitoxin